MQAGRIRIVNYAVNGSGAGHVTRLVSVSRWLRRYAAHAGAEVEIYFLTSSEAGTLLFAEGFPSFKLPSKTMVEEARLDERAFLPIAQAWVRDTLRLLGPSLLISDTFPHGYYDELPAALDLCRRKAFIYRPLKESHATLPAFQRALTLYDAILVPEYEGTQQTPATPEEARDRLHYVGPLIAREREEILSRRAARALLGLEDDELAVYVSAGGGGDAGAERMINAVRESLRGVAGLHLVVGAGPLYRGRSFHSPRVTWLTQGGGAVGLMNGFDVAVSAAGYNSFNELMHVGVATVFIPQEKWADEQLARAARAAKVGAAVVLRTADDDARLREAIELWRDPAARAAASVAARALVPRNHARDAARELLKLVLPASSVEAAAALEV